MALHPLLRRQLAAHAGPVDRWPEWFRDFTDAINAAYAQSDVDRTLLERSLELSSQELLQANSDMRAVIAAFPDLFLWVSAEGTILGCRAQESSDLLLPPHLLVGKQLTDIPDKEAARRFEGALAQLAGGASQATVEYSLDRPPDRRFYEARLVRLDQDQVLVIVRNITERRLARLALEQSVSTLQATLEATNDGILVVDRQGRISSHNQRFVDLWRLPTRVLARQSDDDALAYVLDQLVDPEAFLARVRELYSQPDAESLDEIYLRDGRVFERSSMPQRIDGVSVGRVWSFREITDRRRSEQALRERDEQLRQSQKMEAVGQLAGGIAHDFNNLLTAISGYSGLLLEQMAPGDPLREDVEEIRRAGESAASLTQQLLAFSRRQLLRPRILDLNAVVARVSSLLQRLIGEHITLVSELAPALHRVNVDPGQIEQIIVNLAVNARDAMTAGGTLTIATANVDLDEAMARVAEGLSPRPAVKLVVTDTGIGIPAENRTRIFEPFFSTKPKGEGSGLGLATVYGIVQQSGGLIVLDSEVGVGTSFTTYFPAVINVAEEPAAPAPVAGAAGTETILIAEDQPEVRSVTMQVLKRHGYQVLVAADGPEALEIARHHQAHIDLLLSDVVMPGMSGPELAAELLRLRPGVRVLLASGYTGERLDKTTLQGQAFIPKPFSPGALLSKIREVLRSPPTDGTAEP